MKKLNNILDGMDILLLVLYLMNIVSSIVNKNLVGVMGWACALIMLSRIFMYKKELKK